MTLQTYQDTMLSLILGQMEAPTATEALFGGSDERTSLRLLGYRQGFLGAQDDGLSIQHPQTRAVVEARLGPEGWRALVARFLVAHPPMDPHRVVAFAPFPDFVAEDPELPPWLGDLARLERAALLADIAPDTADAAVDEQTRVLALDWDILAWNADGAPELAQDPEARPNLVLTWRGEDGMPLQAEVDALTALALALARRGGAPMEDELSAVEATEQDLQAAHEALVEIGAVRAL